MIKARDGPLVGVDMGTSACSVKGVQITLRCEQSEKCAVATAAGCMRGSKATPENPIYEGRH